MECNKDEALRAKEIAERKLNDKDYVSAKKFVLKAQNLYPGLEGIPQMLTTLEIYLSAQNVISNGEVDWYSVLGVSPWADEDTVRKKYRKLALALHPDKNKTLGADGAFKLVTEAWSLLSDKDSRVAYNKKLNHRENPRQSKASSTTQPSANANGFHSSKRSAAKTPPSNKKQNTFAGATANKADTFWTICDQCKTQFEYLRVYHNHTLLCPNCHQAFYAIERAPPPNVMKPPPNQSQSQPRQQKHKQKSKPPPPRNPAGGSRVNGAGGTNASTSTGPGAAATTVHDWLRNHIPKREGGAMPPEEDQLLKRKRGNETYMTPSSHENKGPADVFEFKVETERVYSFPGHSKARRDLTSVEIRNILVGKARLAVSEKLEEWSTREAKVSNSGKKKPTGSSVLKGESKIPSNLKQGNEAGAVPQPMSINVPDPDFHNFDSDRTESSFRDDQVWAAYDENDGMPRYYAKIHKVVSLQPFKLKISWLNSKTNSEFSTLDWVGSGFLKTCGDFRIGKHEMSETLNAFSHELKWTKNPRGIIRILPSKGDVWALYRNWSPDWNRHTPDEVVRKYDMVEVLEDYDEERGTSVIPLVKLKGFKTVFSKPSMDSNVAVVMRIPKEEMFRFSHRVPHHLLTGEEAANVPSGCFDLDPAATPLELLQKEDEMQEG